MSPPVHPRACGERFDSVSCLICWSGASPRMRGTGISSVWLLHRPRCIPAHAGNGGVSVVLFIVATVHPRACGERCIHVISCLYTIGASPRMRGTGRLRHRRRIAKRCIPAHAGNGVIPTSTTPLLSVHPRACGERPARVTQLGTANGASPRMRGTDWQRRAAAALRRCIPAHAGNGPSWSWRWRLGPVHPRACGERMAIEAYRTNATGASPRMRGTGR